MPHRMHTHWRIVTGTNTERYTTYSSIGCNVGVGVDVAMGVMVDVANVAVRDSGVVTNRKQKNMVKMHFHWFACVHPTDTATATKGPTHDSCVSTVHRFGMHNHTLCLDLYRHNMKFIC